MRGSVTIKVHESLDLEKCHCVRWDARPEVNVLHACFRPWTLFCTKQTQSRYFIVRQRVEAVGICLTYTVSPVLNHAWRKADSMCRWSAIRPWAAAYKRPIRIVERSAMGHEMSVGSKWTWPSCFPPRTLQRDSYCVKLPFSSYLIR